MSLITRECIDAFYRHRRIAVIGASRDPRKYGRRLFETLLKKGYEALAVNPLAGRLGEAPCFPSVLAIEEPVEAAIVVVPPDQQERVVLECAQAGVRQLWIHEHVMKGVSNPKAIYLCEQHGMEVITGYCPFMFMPGAGFPHNLHGWILKRCGGSPR